MSTYDKCLNIVKFVKIFLKVVNLLTIIQKSVLDVI